MLLFALIISNIFWILSFINSLMQLTNLSSETLRDLDSSVLLSVNKFFNKIYHLNTRPATEFISRDVQDKVLAKRQNV